MILLEATGGGQQQVIQNLILLAVMFLFLYFLFIRPEQKRRKNLKSMQEGLKIGQKVYAGAIVGTIKKIDATTCTVHSGTAEVEVLKLAVSFVEVSKEEDQQPIA